MSREEEVLDQFVDEDEVISPRLLFCKYFEGASENMGSFFLPNWSPLDDPARPLHGMA